MTNGTFMSKSKPKDESTARPVEVTPRMATQTLFLTLSSLRCKITHVNKNDALCILSVTLNKTVVCDTNLTHDRTENRMVIKKVMEKSCVTDSELFSNSCCLDMDVK